MSLLSCVYLCWDQQHVATPAYFTTMGSRYPPLHTRYEAASGFGEESKGAVVIARSATATPTVSGYSERVGGKPCIRLKRFLKIARSTMECGEASVNIPGSVSTSI